MKRRIRAALSGRGLIVAFVCYGLALAWFIASGIGSEATRSLLANVWYVPIGATSALLAWQVSRAPALPSRQRMAWKLLALASMAALLSDGLWIYVENIRGEDPSSNLAANFGYLLYYPGLLASFMLLPQALRSRQDALKFSLDVGIVVVAGTMTVWQFVIAPLIVTLDPSPVAFGLALAYPVGDLLLLLGLATVLLRCPRSARRGPIMLLAASVTAMMAADVVWAHLSLSGAFEAGNVQDLPYLAQYVLFATALVEERRRQKREPVDEPEPTANSVSALPYVAVAGGYALFIGSAWDRLDDQLMPVALGATLLTVLVIIRQIVAQAETARLDRERTLLAGEKRFKSLIQHASDVVSIIDSLGTVRFASPSAAQTLGYPAASLVGQPALDLIHPDDVAEARQKLTHLAANPGHVLTARWRLRHSDGRWLSTDNTATNLMADENIRGLVLATRDVSERVSLETKLTHQAHHDPLTGLANRVLFQRRLEEALARRAGEGGTVAVLFIDLDKFKEMNDSYGHEFGDAVLKAASHRMAAGLRSRDMAARLGGDEFAVLFDDPSGQIDPPAIAARLAHEFHTPFKIKGREVVMTASIGVAVANPSQTAQELQRDADLAMYIAKGRGRGQAAMFEPSLHSALIDRLELQAELRNAAANCELSLVYQPQHALDGHRIVGAEALMRWTHPTRGAIPPDVFIPIAEESGLIVPMGRWALNQACVDAQRWSRGEPDEAPIRLSVNLSGHQLADNALADDVQHALQMSRLDPSRLVLELTESVLLDHTDQTLAAIQRLKRLGLEIAIDDFGTGYSSLSYLRHLPVDELKIDRSFVEHIGVDRGTAAVTRAIVAMAQALSLRTVAEGVQSLEDAEQLRHFGCDLAQGFYFSTPMRTADFELYARRSRMISAA